MLTYSQSEDKCEEGPPLPGDHMCDVILTSHGWGGGSESSGNLLQVVPREGWGHYPHPPSHGPWSCQPRAPTPPGRDKNPGPSKHFYINILRKKSADDKPCQYTCKNQCQL